jgi:hypothetical protein
LESDSSNRVDIPHMMEKKWEEAETMKVKIENI